jgi:hypothetical protein
MKMAFCLAAAVIGSAALAQEWKPAEAPLMTRWAAEVDPAAPLPEYPRPQMVRKDWLNLNGLWEFAPAAEGEAPPFGKTLEGRILVPFCVESALSGVGERRERVWYRKVVKVPSFWREAHTGVLLHFGAVDFEADVYVNGKHLANHKGGFDPFTVDANRAMRLADAEMEIIVGVFDPSDGGTQPRGKQVAKPEGIWYTPVTGIWQTVWMEPVGMNPIEGLRITPDVAGERVLVKVTSRRPADDLIVEVSTPKGVVATGRGSSGKAISLALPSPRLWTTEDPFLYDLTVRTERRHRDQDEVRSYFAMREVSLGKDDAGITRIMLNGEPVFQVGLLDQGYWPDGLYTAPTDEALRFDLEQAKALGFNMVRKHVKVEPQRWYYHADRLGLLVWQDMPSGDAYIGPRDADITRTPESGAQFERELAAMIENLGNHPSIIMWVPYNEGWGQWETARIAAMVKELDPTRLVNSASGWTDRGVGDVHDWHIYPGPGSPVPEENRAAVLGEFGGLGLGVDGHTWAKQTWGYQGMSDRAALTDRYVELLRRSYALRDDPGLSAVVYTQLTDVETECNGLLTYDRAVVKVDADAVRAANAGRFPPVEIVVPTSEDEPIEWSYTFTHPGENWTVPGATGGDWKRGPGGFGTEGTPGSVVRTVWDGPSIWIRREFALAAVPGSPRLLIHHDEDAEVYINGILAASLKGYTTGYELATISAEAAASLRPGVNTIAIRCTQTRGGQYIDAGLASVGRP